jgi:hypothetical protein
VTSQPSFFEFLNRALCALAAEVPSAYSQVCRRLCDLDVRIEVDGATRYLVTTERGHELTRQSPSPAPLELATSKTALVALLNDRKSLLESVLADDFSLRGETHDLMRLEDALFTFVQGAARSRRAISLLADYLKGSNAQHPDLRPYEQASKRNDA